MTRHYQGKPFLTIRLEPEAMEALKARVEPASGKAGGVALLVRRLIYEYLGMPLPVQYGDLGRSSNKREKTGRRGGWPKGKPRRPAPAEESCEAEERT